jgi:hypothetical protein
MNCYQHEEEKWYFWFLFKQLSMLLPLVSYVLSFVVEEALREPPIMGKQLVNLSLLIYKDGHDLTPY